MWSDEKSYHWLLHLGLTKLRHTIQIGTTVDVRFGSLADIAAAIPNVRFTPRSRHHRAQSASPLCAINRHRAGAIRSPSRCGRLLTSHPSFPPSSAAPVPRQDPVPYGATSLAISAQPEPRRCAIESECAAPRLTRNITAAGHCLADRAECDGTNKAQVLSP